MHRFKIKWQPNVSNIPHSKYTRDKIHWVKIKQRPSITICRYLQINRVSFLDIIPGSGVPKICSMLEKSTESLYIVELYRMSSSYLNKWLYIRGNGASLTQWKTSLQLSFWVKLRVTAAANINQVLSSQFGAFCYHFLWEFDIVSRKKQVWVSTSYISELSRVSFEK